MQCLYVGPSPVDQDYLEEEVLVEFNDNGEVLSLALQAFQCEAVLCIQGEFLRGMCG